MFDKSHEFERLLSDFELCFLGMELLAKLLALLALTYTVPARVTFHVAPKYEVYPFIDSVSDRLLQECFQVAIDRIKELGCPEHDIDKTLGMSQVSGTCSARNLLNEIINLCKAF